MADPPWRFQNSTGKVAPGRRQVNMIQTRKREHSRKPDEQYGLIESCSPGPYLELFGRGVWKGWASWGNQADESYEPKWKTAAHHSGPAAKLFPQQTTWLRLPRRSGR